MLMSEPEEYWNTIRPEEIEAIERGDKITVRRNGDEWPFAWTVTFAGIEHDAYTDYDVALEHTKYLMQFFQEEYEKQVNKFGW